MIDFIIYIIEWLFGGFFKKSTPAVQVRTVVNNQVPPQPIVLAPIPQPQQSQPSANETLIEISGAPNNRSIKPMVSKIQNSNSFFPPIPNLVGHLNSTGHSAFIAYKNK